MGGGDKDANRRHKAREKAREAQAAGAGVVRLRGPAKRLKKRPQTNIIKNGGTKDVSVVPWTWTVEVRGRRARGPMHT